MIKDPIYSEFSEICRKEGWKCTSQRLAVYRFLRGNLTHPAVDAVWTAVRSTMPAITRESVYRILNEFSDRGIIARLDQIDNARYDSRTDPHGHFICTKCGKISDFNWTEGITVPVNIQPGKVVHMEICAVGICEDCAAEIDSFPEKSV